MRKLLLCLAILFSIIWIYTICVNIHLISAVNIPFIGQFSMNTSWVLLSFGLFTILIDGLSVIWYLLTKTDLNKNYQIKMDKLSVQADSEKSRVQVLENKIKTLEAVIDKLTKKE